jgi:hypothetical protein
VNKEIRKQIERARSAGLTVTENPGRAAHTWGWIRCSCGKRIPVYSTGRNAEQGAQLLRRFIDTHREHYMAEFEFSLTVDRDATEMPYVEALFELAEGGSVPEGGSEPYLVHTYREAESLAAAITATVAEVESIGLAVTGVVSDDLVSLKDIAARTGRSYESVRLLATGKRGPGGFPVPYSTGQWALYSWALVSAWLACHYGSEAVSVYDREIAADDHLLRARHMLAGDEHRAAFAGLVGT